MKLDADASKKLQALLEKLRARFSPDPADALDPITQLTLSFLQWEATAKEADQAFGALMEKLVDINELRVSHTYELVEIIGEDYPFVEERLARLKESLNEIFVREYAVEIKSVADRGKKDQRAYLDTLPGITPYVAAQVLLLSFGGHAMPVDDKLAALLHKEEIFEPGLSPAMVEDALLKEIKAADAVQAHQVLQAWSDSRKRPEIPQPVAAGSTPGPTKKSTKKKTTTKKTTTKNKADSKKPAAGNRKK